MALSDRLLKAWYDGHPALKHLQPLETLYRRVVTRKRERFLAGEGTIYQSPVPIVVVGNITVGGTGKTPLILWLIEHCQRSGLRVGVVSRGYGAKPAQLPWRVQASDSAQVAGDEPLLIVQRSGVPLMIDPDRSRAVQALLASETLDLILSDDGLQHYRLARDLELVLIDNARGLGNRRCLPAGPLREPVERLHSVDALLYNGAGADREDGFAFRLLPTTLVNLLTGERDVLARTLAEHDDVAALWYCGGAEGVAMVETASAGNLKPVWTDGGRLRDWRDPAQGQGADYLRRATQVKTIWLPYGE